MIFWPSAWRTRRARKSIKTAAVKRSLKNAKLQTPLVRDRRDHVRAEALAAPLHERGLSDRRPGAAGAVVGAQPHLVRPQDQRSLPVGAPLQLRVALVQPARDRPRVLLQRPPRRLLRTEAPDAQIPPRRLLRDRDPEPALDQLADERPRPQEPRQLELIGILLPDRLRDLRLLPRSERRLLPSPATASPRRQRLLTAAPMRSNPLVHRLPRHIKQSRHLALRPPLPNKRDR